MDENNEASEISMKYMIRKNLMSKNKLAIILRGSDGVTQYCCVECPMRYTDKTELEIHLCTHIKEYRFLCGICGKGLKRREHLERHTLEHQEVRPHICTRCNKGFKRKEHLNIHMAIHTGDKSQECSICGRSFNRKDHLQKHLQTHSKAFLEQNIHPMTDEEMMSIKQEVMDDYASPVITNVVSQMDSSEDYEESYGGKPKSNLKARKESRYACYMCEKTYKMKEHFESHLALHMKSEEAEEISVVSGLYIKPYDGDESQWEAFNGQNEQEVEDMDDDTSGLLVARPLKDSEHRPHQCGLCHKKFKRRQHLKVHMNVHMKHQPTIWCSLCNEGFFSNVQFENHNCSAEGEEQQDTQDIEITDDAASTRTHVKKENKLPPGGIKIIADNLQKDEATYMMVHDEQNIPVPQRVYVCKYCGKPFRRKDHYKIHLHIHTGVKSFFCVSCGKGFYRKDHLQKHALVHERAKPKFKPKKQLPDLYPISMANKTTVQAKPELRSQAKPQIKSQVKPEITITALSNAKLRVPLQIKVPYQMVTSSDNGEQRAVTIDPQASANSHVVVT